MSLQKTETLSSGQTVDYWRIFRWDTRRDASGTATTNIHYQGWIDKANYDAGNDKIYERMVSVSGDLSGVDSVAEAYTATKAADEFFKDAVDV